MKREAFTIAQMVAALKKTKGMVYLAAEDLGCSYQTVYNYIHRHPKVKDAFDGESGKMLDIGEMKLYQSVLNGEAWGVTLLLTTKGRRRGYVKQTEHTGVDGGPVVATVGVTHEYDDNFIATVCALLVEHGGLGTPAPPTDDHGTAVE